jgi:homoserine kinase type II
MAVKTAFSHSDLAQILADYDLGALQHAQSLAGGAVQTNYRLQTTRGEYVLKYYETRPLESVRFEANLIDYIRRVDYPCPAVLKNAHGMGVGIYDQKPYVIFEFAAGQPVQPPNRTQREQIIQMAARLQIITRHYRPRWRAYRWNYSPELCLHLAQTAAAKLGTQTAQDKVHWFEQALANLALPRALPKGICHCDYDYSNILFQGDDLVALLDFDDANYTYLTFDLVNLIDNWAWSFEQPLNLELARQIAQTYHRTRPLSTLEKRHLFDVHQLQILFDGIWFFARGQVEDFYERRKIADLDRLGREGYASALLD